MAQVRITQFHLVDQAKAELVARGCTITDVQGGGPWLISYDEMRGKKSDSAPEISESGAVQPESTPKSAEKPRRTRKP